MWTCRFCGQQWAKTREICPGCSGGKFKETEVIYTTGLPLRTGVFDAKADNELFAWTALLGLGAEVNSRLTISQTVAEFVRRKH